MINFIENIERFDQISDHLISVALTLITLRLFSVDENIFIKKLIKDFINIHIILDIANVIRKYILKDADLIEIPIQ